jgi:hypothetical protein
MGMKRKMTPKQFRSRVAVVMREELKQPERWHYVSFAGEKFLGVVIIQAHGVGDATMKCGLLGINPGGEVMCVAMPDGIVAQVPESYRNRLLSKAEVLELWPEAKSQREWEKEGIA